MQQINAHWCAAVVLVMVGEFHSIVLHIGLDVDSYIVKILSVFVLSMVLLTYYIYAPERILLLCLISMVSFIHFCILYSDSFLLRRQSLCRYVYAFQNFLSLP